MKKELLTYPTIRNDDKRLSDQFFQERNAILIFGAIGEELASYVISSLMYQDALFKENNVPRSEREINIWIKSHGGSDEEGMAIYDTMNYVDADIRTTCVGQASHIAAFLLSAGTKGKREALPNSEIIIRQPLGGTQGQASDIISYANDIIARRERLDSLLAIHTGRPIDQIRRDTERDSRMSAQEAFEYGIIDRVIATPIKARNIIIKEEIYEKEIDS